MFVLITGGAGFVGSVCTEYLLARGHGAVVVDNLSTGHRHAVPSGAVFYETDFSDQRVIRSVLERFPIDGVMHFAAETVVSKSMTDPRSYFENNVAKGLQFLDVLLNSSVRNFVFSSSAAVYGDPSGVPITESQPTSPISAYGESKLMFERILHWYNRAYGLRYIALRYFNACGATEKLGEDHRPETHILPRLLNSILHGNEEFVIYGDNYPTIDGTCVRDYVHVQDIAQAHLLALEVLKRGRSGIYNIGTGISYSVKEMVTAVEEVTGRQLRYRVGPPRDGDPATLVARNDKICDELGWAPEFCKLSQIVESAWKWKTMHSSSLSQESSRLSNSG